MTKEEFLKRFNEKFAEQALLEACGDYYIKDGREHVVINVDDNVVEIN